MKTRLRNISLVLAWILFIIFIIMMMRNNAFQKDTSKIPTPIDTTETVSHRWDIVDSVDVIPPGQTNTLQFDTKYRIYTENNFEFVTTKKYVKGDSLHYIFYKVKDAQN